MRAYAYVDNISLDHLRPVELPDPEPGPRDVVVRIRAVALNFRDLAIARGAYHVGVSPPLVPLSDGAGEVVAVGPEVTRASVGDLVCPVYLPDWIDGDVSPRVARRRLGGPSDGVLAEFVCLHEDEVVRAPSHLSAEEAATLPVAAVTAWQALHRTSHVRPGDNVLVQGAGGFSGAAIQLASAAGARVISVTRSDHHKKALRQLGAADVIVSSGGTDEMARKIVSMTDGLGAEAVLDVAGGESLNRSIASTRMGGHVHLVGYAADKVASIDIFQAIRHAVTVHVATAGSRESFEALTRAMAFRRLRPPVGRLFKATEIHVAFDALGKGGGFGKLVLTL